jgi:hypothetical protein
LTASYTGTRSSDAIENGAVTWTATTGQKFVCTWSANFLRPTVGAVLAQVNSLVADTNSPTILGDAVSLLAGGAASGNSEIEADIAIIYLNNVTPLTDDDVTKA